MVTVPTLEKFVPEAPDSRALPESVPTQESLASRTPSGHSHPVAERRPSKWKCGPPRTLRKGYAESYGLIQRLKGLMLHPSLLGFRISHPDPGATSLEFQRRELARQPWPLVRTKVFTKENQRFVLNGEEYEYFYHDYHLTWTNERCVEVPLAISWMSRPGRPRCLEIGNVLSHYVSERPTWTVIDKFEHAPHVLNYDLLDFDTDAKFDCIVSISTLEHVGWDDWPRDKTGASTRKALAKVRLLLADKGAGLVTLPLGYNPFVDAALRDPHSLFDRVDFLRRANWENDWVQVSGSDAFRLQYGKWRMGDFRRADQARPKGIFPQCNALAICQVSSASA